MSDKVSTYEKQLSLRPSELVLALQDILKAGEVPMVHGHPGIGKSDIYRQIAKHFNLEFIDIRLSQIDPVDLNGYLRASTKNPDLATYIPIDIFPLEGAELPEGKDGWLINLDELPSARPAIQAAAYKLLLDRMLGNHKLHSNVALGAAGNLMTSNAIAYEMGTATKSRLVHLVLKANPEDFYTWAVDNNVDSRVLSFLQFRPELVMKFDPNTDDFTFACPRTWFKLSNIIKRIETKDLFGYRRKIIAGTVSSGAANEFISFLKIFGQLPTLDDIVGAPDTTPVSKEPSVLYALTGFLSENINKNNAKALVTFLKRLPIEFQIITIIPIIKHRKELLAEPAISNWLMENANRMEIRNV